MKNLLFTLALAAMLAGCTTTTTTIPVPHSKADCETQGIGGDPCHTIEKPAPPALPGVTEK